MPWIVENLETPHHERRVVDLYWQVSPDEPNHHVATLGQYHYHRTRTGLLPHRHDNQMEICFLAKGAQTYTVDGMFYALHGGDVFVTFPDELHSSGGYPEEKGHLFWVILDMPRPEEPFLGLQGAEAASLAEALLDLPCRHFRGRDTMTGHMEELFSVPALSKASSPMPLVDIRIQHALIGFLLETLEAARVNAPFGASLPIKKVQEAIEDNLEKDLSVEDMAAMTSLSVSRFKARFREEVGMPPAEYLNRRRVAHAAMLLYESDIPVTELAFRLGFHSSQYFATVFRKFTGQSPSEYRRLS